MATGVALASRASRQQCRCSAVLQSSAVVLEGRWSTRLGWVTRAWTWAWLHCKHSQRQGTLPRRLAQRRRAGRPVLRLGRRGAGPGACGMRRRHRAGVRHRRRRVRGRGARRRRQCGAQRRGARAAAGGRPGHAARHGDGAARGAKAGRRGRRCACSILIRQQVYAQERCYFGISACVATCTAPGVKRTRQIPLAFNLGFGRVLFTPYPHKIAHKFANNQLWVTRRPCTARPVHGGRELAAGVHCADVALRVMQPSHAGAALSLFVRTCICQALAGPGEHVRTKEPLTGDAPCLGDAPDGSMRCVMHACCATARSCTLATCPHHAMRRTLRRRATWAGSAGATAAARRSGCAACSRWTCSRTPGTWRWWPRWSARACERAGQGLACTPCRPASACPPWAAPRLICVRDKAAMHAS